MPRPFFRIVWRINALLILAVVMAEGTAYKATEIDLETIKFVAGKGIPGITAWRE